MPVDAVGVMAPGRTIARPSGEDIPLEIRLDINPAAAPAVISSMTDMAAVATSSVQAMSSSHKIEHLVPYEAPLALAEFLRVLDAQGYSLITCPPGFDTKCLFWPLLCVRDQSNQQLTVRASDCVVAICK